MVPPDSLDTQILTAGTRGWNGVNNRLKAGLIDAAELARLVNGRIDDTGTVQLRPGTEWLARPAPAPVRGLFFYDVPSAEAILACVNGKVWELTAATAPLSTIEIPGATLTTSGACRGAQIVDKFALADGLRLLGLWRENGAWRTLQVATFTDGQLLPPIRHLVSHAFRLFVSGGTGATAEIIYASAILDPWSISTAQGIRVGRGEGDPIVAILPGPAQRLWVGKGGSWWIVDTEGEVNEWRADAVTHQRGCWAGATAVVVNQDVIFLARDGVAALSRLQSDAPVAPVDLLSAPIEATIRRINWTAARRTACAALWGPYYLLCVPLDGGHRNNAVLAYNTVTKQWSDEWTGWTPSACGQSKFDGQLATLIGDESGNLLRLDESLTTDGTEAGTAQPIPLEIETAAYPFDAPDLQKIPVALDCEWRSGAATVDVTLRADGGSPQTIREDYDAASVAGAANNRLIANLRELGGGRELAVRMVSAGGAFGLRELQLKAMPLRARWTPPAAELLIPPIPAEDVAGTETTLRGRDGIPFVTLLQEIDTITLDPDPAAFTCFRGGLTLPPGSYVVAYRRGSFAESDIKAFHNLESEAIGPAWTFHGGTTGWSGPAQTWSMADWGADQAEAYAEGPSIGLYLGFGWAPGLATIQEIAMERGFDSLETYAEGSAPSLASGTGWSAAGTTAAIANPSGFDSFETYTDGMLPTLSAGTGWSAAANIFIPT